MIFLLIPLIDFHYPRTQCCPQSIAAVLTQRLKKKTPVHWCHALQTSATFLENDVRNSNIVVQNSVSSVHDHAVMSGRVVLNISR